MISPTFGQLQKLVSDLSYAELYYAVNSVSTVDKVVDDETIIPWSGAYGAAIYHALDSAIGLFMGGDRVRYVYSQVVLQISDRLEGFCSDTDAAYLPWRVLLIDGTHVIIDGIAGMLDIRDFSHEIALPPPLFTVSVDLTTVWYNLKGAFERLQNVPCAPAELGL